MPASSATAISTLERERVLDALEQERFDCLVIGGGITGAGLLRVAARQGLRTALVEAADFASGTSSRSSKLIHGGLRYLAMGDVRLVRETALERKAIFRLAPHLAERRWMVVPSRSRAGLLKLRAGIAAYEKLGAVEPEDAHRNWNAADLEREEPSLDRTRHPFACAYREYLTDDARLVLANLRAAAADGAVALNHARVESIVREDGVAAGAVVRCALSGRSLRVRAHVLVNAAGPWVEELRRFEDPAARPLLHLSKGIHVVLPAERLPVRNMVVLATRDSRSMFAIRRGPITYLGTTDTSYERGAETWPLIRPEDVEYVLEPIPGYFEVEPLKLEEVVAAWAGLRPLVAEPGKAPAEISRRDEILVGPARVVTIAGGKLTGYRPMARRALEQVAKLLGRELPREADDETPLPGGDFDGDLDALAARVAREFRIDATAAWRLVRLYGAETQAVLARGTEPLAAGVFGGEVDWAVTCEGAATVEDVLYRRTRAAWYDPAVRQCLIDPIARRMAALLAWSPQAERAQAGRARELLEGERAFLRASS